MVSLRDAAARKNDLLTQVWIQLSKTELKLEQGSLLHDPEELFLIDLTITVSVSLVNHFLQTQYLLNVTEFDL